MSNSSWFSKMAALPITLDNLDKVLLRQLRDLYTSEVCAIDIFPKMVNAATFPDLKQAFNSLHNSMREQSSRLVHAFSLIGHQAQLEPCEAMRELIQETEEIIEVEGSSDIKDTALIAATQRITHYQIAGYCCARSFTRRLGYHQAASLLQTTIDERKNGDEQFAAIAEMIVNAPSSPLHRSSNTILQ